MAVVNFEVTRREPFAGGQAFGDVGAYERIDGVLTFAVDPAHEANSRIVDLDLAPRDAEGLVRFESDVVLIAPADPRRGNGALILDVPNRGRGVAVRTLNGTPLVQGISDDPGDGFVFRHGFSVLSVAWQSDAAGLAGTLIARLPRLGTAERPLRGQASAEFTVVARTSVAPLTALGNVYYDPVDPTEPGAGLSVHRESTSPVQIPRAEWRFVQNDPGSAAAWSIECDRGLEVDHQYVVTYTAENPLVAGAGLLALRDAAIFGRGGAGGLLPRQFDRVLGFGSSQTARVFRHMLYEGLTVGEGGEAALDGMHIHIAGGKRGEFNHRYAAPSSARTPGFGSAFPFAFESSPDSLAPRSAGLLDRARHVRHVPKIVATNTAMEYWRGDASLLHVASSGTHDLPGDPGVRLYMFAGTQHIGGVFPLSRDYVPSGIRARYGLSVVDFRPLTKAAFLNLDAWVRGAQEPPPSTHPRLADGTAAARNEVLACFEALPDLVPPRADRLLHLRAVDLGPESDRGVGTYPPKEGDAYPAFVSAVNDDLNEVAGIRLPDITVPVGSHAGWNAGAPDRGDPTVAPWFLGFTRYFPRTEAERAAIGDPRSSLEARYASRDDYIEQVRAAAEQLVAERFLLTEDVDLVVENCALRYDEALRVGPFNPSTAT